MKSRELDYFDITNMLSETMTELEEMATCIESRALSLEDICDRLNSLYVKTKLAVDREELVKDGHRRELTALVLTGAIGLVRQLVNIENYDGPESFDREMKQFTEALLSSGVGR